MMIVQEFRQLLPQAFVTLAAMAEHDGALEQCVLEILRQFAPEIGGRRPENLKITVGAIVDDAPGMLAHYDFSANLTECSGQE
jgi:hypothetical protein